MKFFIRILNVVLNQVPGRSRFDALRTAMSKVNIFLPVSKKRWEIAQSFEAGHFKNVIGDVPVVKGSEGKVLGHYSGGGARFFLDVIETELNFTFSSLVKGNALIEVGCGASSIFLKSIFPIVKIGIDPMNFSTWVNDSYKENQVSLIRGSGENFNLDNNKKLKELVKKSYIKKIVLFTNTLQHVQNINEFFDNLYNQIGEHTLVFVDFLNIPADRAHPQILTEKRLINFLNKHMYTELKRSIRLNFPGNYEQGLSKSIETFSYIGVRN